MDYDTVGGIYYGFCGAIVLLQLEDLVIGVVTPEIEDILDVGPPEAIDALGVVAHHTNVFVIGGQLFYDEVLADIGILVFIHEDTFEPVLIFQEYFGKFFQHDVHVEQQVVEVHGIGLPEPALVFCIDLSCLWLAAHLVCLRQLSILVILDMVDHACLGRGDAVKDITGLIDFRVQFHLLDNVAEQALGIIRVVNRILGGVANPVAFDAEYPGEDGMKGSHPDIPCLGTNQLGDAIFHFPRCFVGKSERQDVERINAFVDQVSHAVGQHARLAAACTGDHHGRPFSVYNGIDLCLIQLLNEVRFFIFHSGGKSMLFPVKFPGALKQFSNIWVSNLWVGNPDIFSDFSYLYMKLIRPMNSKLKKVSPAMLMMLSAMMIPVFLPALKANPIVEPPVLTEIYFGPGGWQIEMRFDEMYTGVIDNLDDCRLKSLFGESTFSPGIIAIPGEEMVVTQDDMLYPLVIDQSGDEIWLEELFNDEWYRISLFPLRFGAQPVGFSMVTAPVGEESIAMCYFYLTDPQHSWNDYWTLKEKPNTIGYDPLTVTKRANFEGFVLDQYQEPLQNIQIRYGPGTYLYGTLPSIPILVTDLDGYFFTDSMFCRCYSLEFTHDSVVIADTGLVCIEPDSANYHTFILDTLLSSTNEMKIIEKANLECYPNPTRGPIHFIIKIPASQLHSSAKIRLFGITNRILDEIPVRLDEQKVTIQYDLGRIGDPAGSLFLYTFEINDRTIASGKFMLNR